jgi:hypothetical protein
MVFTHKQAITRFMTGYIFGLLRDPMAVLHYVSHQPQEGSNTILTYNIRL